MKDKEVGTLLFIAAIVVAIFNLGCIVRIGNTFMDAYQEGDPERWGNFMGEVFVVGIFIGGNLVLYRYGTKIRKEALQKEKEKDEEMNKTWNERKPD